MNGGILQTSLDLLSGRWRALLVVAVLALGPAVAAASLIEVLGTRTGAVVNGSVTGSHPWTDVVLARDVAGGQVRLTIPVLLALAWFVGLGAALRVLGGARIRDAWRAGLGRWLALGAVLGTLTVLSFVASVLMSSFADGLLGILTALLCAYGLARLALALPAMRIGGIDLAGSLRRAVAVTRGRTLPTGTALILVGLGLPWVVLSLADAATLPHGDSWVEDVIWTGMNSLLEYLALVLVFPLQVAVLLGAYRVATLSPAPDDAPEAAPEDGLDPTAQDEPAAQPAGSGDGGLELTVTIDGSRPPDRRPEQPPPVPAPGPRSSAPRSPGWLRVAGTTLLALVPAAVGPAALLANPYGLPVLTIARPESGFSPRPLAMTVLDDGTVAFVDSMQVALCRDAHCDDLDLVSMPCYDGGEPEPVGGSTRGCTTEGPLIGADITADGTLLAVTNGPGQDVRLFWCRLEPTPDGQCRSGGATVLYQQPEFWPYWSMDVTALPGGGFAVIMIAPGPDEETLTLRLALCDRLDCPQPTVHSGLTVPRSSESGLVAIAADAGTGSLALGYLDRLARSVWLGGCPAGCPGGPVLNAVYSPGDYVINQPPRLQVEATSAGPVALLNLLGSEAGPTGAVIGCRDRACATAVDAQELASFAVLAVNRAGEAVVFGSDTSSHVGLAQSLAGAGEVVAAACGPDGRLVLVVHDEKPNPAVVTYSGPYCGAGVHR